LLRPKAQAARHINGPLTRSRGAATANASAETRAPSTALRAVPLPRCAREESAAVDRADAANGRVYKAKRFHYNAESLPRRLLRG